MGAFEDYNEFIGFLRTQYLLPYVVGPDIEIVSLEQTKKNCRIDALAILKKGEKTYKVGIEFKNLNSEIYIKESKVRSTLTMVKRWGLCGVLYFAYVGLHNLYVFNMDDILNGVYGEPEDKVQRVNEWEESGKKERLLTYHLPPEKAIKQITY